LRLAFGGELRSGRSYSARLFDPLLLTGRDVNRRVAAESTLVVSDSADLDSTTMTWVTGTLRHRARIPHRSRRQRGGRADEQLDRCAGTRGACLHGRRRQSRIRDGARGIRDRLRELQASRHRAGGAQQRRSRAGGDRSPDGTGRRCDGQPHSAPAHVAAQKRPRHARDRSGGRTRAHAAPYRLPSRDTALARWLAPGATHPEPRSEDRRAGAANHRTRTQPAAVAELLAQWVHRSLHRSIPIAGSAPSAVQEVLEKRQGDCNEATTLYVALARSDRVAGADGVGPASISTAAFTTMRVAEIYLNELGSRWTHLRPIPR